ncbi:MAG: hypothetical protein IJI36_18450 [Kiritimatiellae bacterium]|nr:hypothetical protein [Kiritimatiellia bacterium]
MSHQSFSWDRFFEWINIRSDNVTSNAWQRALDRDDLNVANRMFYTAYLVASNVLNDRFAVSWNEIEALNLKEKVSSYYFCSHRDALREQMNRVGAKLLQHHGESQYIRTIAFYSGVAFVKVIKNIADKLREQTRTLTDYALQYHTPEEVKNELRVYVEQSVGACLSGFPNEDERNGVRDDIYDTLIHLMDLYRERLTNFSVEDLLEVCCLPVPRPSAQKIAELFGQVSQERIKIGIGVHGEGVFKFPARAPLLSSDNKGGTPYDSLWIKIVHGKDGNDNATWITYKREDGGQNWLLDYTGGTQVVNGYAEVPLADVNEISRIPVLNGEQCINAAMDIRPRVCDNRYILYVEHAGNASIYLPGRKVYANDVCHVFPTASIGELKVSVRDDDGELRDIETKAISRIALEGNNLETLIIDGDEYPIVSNADNVWLDKERRFRYLYRAGRRAYQAGACPIAVDKVPAAAKSITYRVGDDVAALMEKNGGQWGQWHKVPPRLLWKRGTIEVRGDFGVLESAQVIFVNVKFGDFDVPSQVDEELDPASIQYQNESGEWISPDINSEHGDSMIQFTVGDLTIRKPIDRVGVFFVVPNGLSISITPESEDWREATPLAKRDIYNLVCKVVVPADSANDYKVLLIRGGEHIELKRIAQEKLQENGHTTFHWRDYVGKFSERNKDSDYFAICIRSEDQLWLYKFKAIDPVMLRYQSDGVLPPHTVRHELRADGTLVARHFMAYADIPNGKDGMPTSFLCCPIDRLDDENGFVELLCKSEFSDGNAEANGWVTQETVRVPNFREQLGEHLGSGCVCFLAKKQQYINSDGFEHRLISSGFFVRDPTVQHVVSGTDVVSRLREAFARKDENVIRELLASEDEEIRCVVKGVLDRVWRNVTKIHAPEVRDYLNLYRCVIRNEQGQLIERSGYAFLADWYDFGQNGETLHGVSRHLSDEYQKYWPRLMFPIRRNEASMQGVTVGEYLEGQSFKAQCRMLSSPILDTAMFLELYDAVNAVFSFEGTRDHGTAREWIGEKKIGRCFYAQYFEYCCDNNIRINWNDHRTSIQRAPAQFRRIIGQKPYLFYEGLSLSDQLRCTAEVACGLRKREIRSFIQHLAEELCAWRKQPNLDERAQRLKENLLLLERIDDILFSAPPNGNGLGANAPCCFTELVELLAFDQFVHSI